MAHELVYVTLDGCESQARGGGEAVGSQPLSSIPGSQRYRKRHYDVVSEAESLRRPFMAMYYHCAGLVDKNHVVVLGGLSGENSLLPLHVVRTLQLNCHSPACKAQWLAPYRTINLKPVPRFNATLTADENSNLYLIGGLKSDNTIASTPFVYSVPKRKWKPIDTNSKINTKKAKLDMLGPRYAHVAVFRSRTLFSGRTNRGQIIVHGGYDSNEPDTSPKSDVHVFDIYSKKWTVPSLDSKSMTSAPALAEHAAVLLKNRWFVVFGGRDGDLMPKSDVFVLDLHRNQWIKPTMRAGDIIPQGRAGHMMAESIFANEKSLECIVYGGATCECNGDEVFLNEVLRLTLVPDERANSQQEILWVSFERVKVVGVGLSQPNGDDDDLNEQIPEIAYGSMVPWVDEKAYVIVGGFGSRGSSVGKPFLLKLLDQTFEEQLAKTGKQLVCESQDLKLVEKRSTFISYRDRGHGAERAICDQEKKRSPLPRADRAKRVEDGLAVPDDRSAVGMLNLRSQNESKGQSPVADNSVDVVVNYSSPLNEYLASVSNDPTESAKGSDQHRYATSGNIFVGSKRPRDEAHGGKDRGGEEASKLAPKELQRTPGGAASGDEMMDPVTSKKQLRRLSAPLADQQTEAKPVEEVSSLTRMPMYEGSSPFLDTKKKARTRKRNAERSREPKAKECVTKKRKVAKVSRAGRGRGRGQGETGLSGGGAVTRRGRTRKSTKQLPPAIDDSGEEEKVSNSDYEYLLDKLDEAESKIKEREEAISKERAEKNALFRSLEEYRADNAELRRLCDRGMPSGASAPEEDRPPSVSELPQLRAQVAHLEDVKSFLSEELEEKKKCLKETNDIVSEKDQEIKMLEIEVARLKGKIKKLNESLTAVRQMERDAQKHRQDAEISAKEAFAKQSKDFTDLISAQKKGEELGKRIDTLRERKAALEADIKLMRLKDSDSQKRIRELGEQYAKLLSENKVVSKEKETLSKSRDDLYADLVALQRKLADLETSERNLSAKQSQAEDSKQQLEARASAAESGLAGAQAEILKLTQKLADALVECNQRKRDHDAMTEDAARMRDGLGRISEALQGQVRQVTRLFESTMNEIRNLLLR